jgi:hypothetical protein
MPPDDTMFRVLIGLSAIILFYVIGCHLRAKQKRRTCRRVLRDRPDCDLDIEFRIIANREAIDRAQLSRLWNGLASFYGVPPRKLRAADRLQSELEPLFGDAYVNLWEISPLLRHRGPAMERAMDLGKRETSDLGDFILVLRQYEVELGRALVKEVPMQDGAARFVWIK